MARRGSGYEQVVGSVCRALEPGANVQVGTWTLGPDGRRDMDVSIRGTRDGQPFLALVECKDWKDPVGVAVLDALDSKRRDLGADVSAIYSNSGFTEDAKRKAVRVGISLCAAMKAGDRKIRIVVERQFYARLCSVDRWSVVAYWRKDRPGLNELDPQQLSYGGDPVTNWISQKSRQLIFEHADKPYIQAEYGFRDDVEFETRGERIYLIGLVARLHCSTNWVRQTVREDVTLGSYDLLQRKLIIPDKEAWSVGPFDAGAWEPVETPPPEPTMEPNSIRLNLTLLRPVAPIAGKGTPGLDELVLEHAVTFGPQPA